MCSKSLRRIITKAEIWRRVSFLSCKTFPAGWSWVKRVHSGRCGAPGGMIMQEQQHPPSQGRLGGGAARSVWTKSSYFIFLGNDESLKATGCFLLYSHYSKKGRCLVHPIRQRLGVEMSFFPTWMIDDSKRLGCPQEPWECIRIFSARNGAQIYFPGI